MDKPLSFGRLLRSYRRARDLTQEELAQRSYCALTTIKKIEADERRPSRELAERFAQVLEVPQADVPAFRRLARGLLPDAAPRLPFVVPALTSQEVGAEDLSGRELRGYALRERLGIGGFGAVYRALQSSIQREVAVKIILPRYANHPDFVRRFEAEAQFVARLEHPYIVPLYDYWREPNSACLVMRYLRGGSLASALRDGPLAPGAVLQVLEQVGAALEAAHRAGVVHRDLKPANLLRDAEGNTFLGDFGIAKDLSIAETDGATQVGAIVGSPDYLSPEQITDEPITPRTDIYSLGVMLYELLTGAKPFATRTPAELLRLHLTTPLPSLRERRPELPEALDALIQCATAKNPGERYPDTASLVSAFRAVVSAPTPAIRAPDAGHELITMDAERRTVVLDVPELKNPYKGLRAFGEADATDFFGREALVARLLERLAEEPGTGTRRVNQEPVAGEQRTKDKEQRSEGQSTTDNEPRTTSRFLAVVGPSGSGKSSVVRAGLIPALRQGGLPGSEQWFIADFIPGAHPLEELELALLKVAVRQPAGLAEQLQRDARGLLRAARLILPNDETSELLLVIDQFEEVFTLVQDEAARTHFLESLVAAATASRSWVRIVATLRADFYDRPLGYSGLGALLQERTEVVLPLNPDEIEQAIAEPARRAGVSIEPELVAEFVRDAGAQPGVLPLLQYALTELFERREGRVLTRTAYRASGGVRGALTRRAEELYRGLDAIGQEAARQLFLRLVTLGEGVEDTRRRVMRSELESVATDNGPLTTDQVIDCYGRARLLTFDRDPLTRAPTVEVAHEALLREWPRLRAWLDASRADVRLLRQLAAAAAEWNAGGRDPSYLLSGARLAQFEGWAAGSDLALNQDERAYLEASLAERDTQRAREAARTAHETALERRARRRLQGLIAVLAVATMIAIGLTLFAFNQARLATSRELASAAISNLTIDPERSILLALQGLSVQDTLEAEDALHRAVQASRVQLTLTGHTDGLEDVAFSSDGKRLATAGWDKTAKVWDAATGKQLLTLTGHTDGLEDVAFSSDGTRLATASKDKTAKVWDAATGKQLLTLTGHADEVWSVTFSPDGTRLATASKDKTAKVWDAATGKQLLTLSSHTDEVWSVAFSPDGTRLATASKDKTAKVWDAATGKQLLTLSSHVFALESVVFSPDGTRLATGADDTTAKVWDATSGEELFSLSGHTAPIYDVAFSPDGTHLATGSSDGTAKVWDAATGNELFALSGHARGITGLAFSPECAGPSEAPFIWCGTYVATASRDGTAKVWDISPAGSRELLTTRGIDARFSIDGTRLMTADFADKTFATIREQVWLLPKAPGSGEESFQQDGDRATGAGRALQTYLFAHPAIVTAGGSSPDRTHIITISMDGMAKVWDLATGTELRTFTLAGHTGAVYGVAFSPDGTRLATVGDDRTAKVWDIATGKELLTLSGHAAGMEKIAFSGDGTRLATASDDRTAKVWDAATGKELLTLTGHTLDVRAIAFNGDGTYLATGSLDGTAKLWDAATGKELFTLSGHTAVINDLAFSPDGTRLATGSNDGSVKVWDAVTGEELLTLSGRTGWIITVTFSPDGKRLAASSFDVTGTVHVYTLTPEELAALARSRLTRTWMPDECRKFLHLEQCPPTP